jgi:hypothetical protein
MKNNKSSKKPKITATAKGNKAIESFHGKGSCKGIRPSVNYRGTKM